MTVFADGTEECSERCKQCGRFFDIAPNADEQQELALAIKELTVTVKELHKTIIINFTK